MDWTDAVKIVGAIGGVATVAGGVAAFVGQLISSRIVQSHKAILDQQLETHKDLLARESDRHRLLLKRQELMFEREYAAAAEFFRLVNSIVPAPWAPGLDWPDAQPKIAENFPRHAEELRKFLDTHSASLGEEVRKFVSSAQSQATQGWFEVAQETKLGEYEPGDYPSDIVARAVDQFYADLQQAERRLRIDLKEGSFTSASPEALATS